MWYWVFLWCIFGVYVSIYSSVIICKYMPNTCNWRSKFLCNVTLLTINSDVLLTKELFIFLEAWLDVCVEKSCTRPLLKIHYISVVIFTKFWWWNNPPIKKDCYVMSLLYVLEYLISNRNLLIVYSLVNIIIHDCKHVDNINLWNTLNNHRINC